MTKAPSIRKLTSLHGSLPKRGRVLNRKVIANEFSISISQLQKAYLNWQDIFRDENSTLTFEQYLIKLQEAKITPDDVGNNIGQYNLARYNDTGAYTLESCRFITRDQNLKEVKRKVLVHGSNSTLYNNYKCRCELCVGWNRRRQRKLGV